MKYRGYEIKESTIKPRPGLGKRGVGIWDGERCRIANASGPQTAKYIIDLMISKGIWPAKGNRDKEPGSEAENADAKTESMETLG